MATAAEQLVQLIATLRSDGKIDTHEFDYANTLINEVARGKNDRLRTDNAAAAAAAAVLGTAELVTMIFENLGVHDLANSAAPVCRTWRHIVHGTPSLRRELFLDADRNYTVASPRLPVMQNVHYCVTKGFVDILIIKMQHMMTINTRLWDVYTMQPPPTRLMVTYNTVDGIFILGEIVNDAGITFGFLWTKIECHQKQWQVEHPLSGVDPCVIEARALLCTPQIDNTAP